MQNETPEETPAEQNEQTPAPAAEQPETPQPETPAEPQAAEAAPEQPEAAPAGTELPELTLGAGAPADETAEPVMPQLIRGKVDRFGAAMGTGRRKTAVARVRIKDGNGAFTINGRSLEDFCTVERDRRMIEAPLKATQAFGTVDVWVRVNGGGTTGQAGAIVLGIARALQARNPELHEILSDGGYLTRDGRMVERKKYGYKKARKSFQFSKR